MNDTPSTMCVRIGCRGVMNYDLGESENNCHGLWGGEEPMDWAE
jgi:hypothetical protein